jgi:hypothetical protein
MFGAGPGAGRSDSITARSFSTSKEVNRLNIETLEAPLEPASAIAKGT